MLVRMPKRWMPYAAHPAMEATTMQQDGIVAD